jgi:MGT family glycosyltransferase
MTSATRSRMPVVDVGASRGHIAMFNIPRHGHVNPSLAVIRELVDRGYRVTYSINEEFLPQIEEAGATPVLYQSTLLSEPDPAFCDTGGYYTAPIPGAKWLDEAIAVLPQMQAAYDADRPDLFLYDICGYTAPVLAAKWDIPIIRLSPTYVAWEGYEEDVPVFEVMRADPLGAAYYARFAAWFRAHGIVTSLEDFVLRPQRCIALIPRVLQPYETKVADTYTFVGPCFGDRSFEGSWQPPGDGRPVLLISLGSAGADRVEFYRECITAFTGLDWHVVMAIGRFVDLGGLGPVLDDIEVHRWVPQFSVLSQADAFITHAGPASISEGLYHGVPMLAVPQAWDQFRIAARIAELGVGRHLPREQATAAALREAVLAVAGDPCVVARLTEIQGEIRRNGGTTAAANLIEQHLGAR